MLYYIIIQSIILCYLVGEAALNEYAAFIIDQAGGVSEGSWEGTCEANSAACASVRSDKNNRP